VDVNNVAITRDVQVRTGGGDDMIDIIKADVLRKVRIDSGLSTDLGMDVINLTGQGVGAALDGNDVNIGDDLDIKSKGTAQINLDRVGVADRTKIRTGNGDDVVSLMMVFGTGRTQIDTKDGTDDVDLLSCDFSDDLTGKTGNGDDDLFVSDTNFADKVTVDGGGDADVVECDLGSPNTFAVPPVSKNFETETNCP
ncbi:MAG: hypothetical protein OER86_03965, partial [Phycisphaerae bacterium]|nr:hypothetical protein [Phycisphaerae bacterium]